MASDPRIAPVEDNIVFFVESICSSGPDWIVDRSDQTVTAYSSEVSFPLFNVVTGAQVVGGDSSTTSEAVRTVVSEYTNRGLPWMWWTTPSHTTSEVEGILAHAGMISESVPGMYAELAGLRDPDPVVETLQVPARDAAFGDVFIRGFGLPEAILDPVQDFLGSFDDEEHVVVVATDGGRAVGCATGLIANDTIGIYNVATLPDARGRGVGTAVTLAVMQTGKERGCKNAILHTSPMGRGVYERLGFEVVCPTTHWVWSPGSE